MSATAFAVPANNVVASVGSGGYTSGSGTLVLQTGDGAKFPVLTGSQFYRLTVVQQAVAYSGTATSANLTIFKATSRVGDTFSGVTVIEGTTDRNYVSGDVVDVRVTSGTIGDIQTAVNALENTYANQGLTSGNSLLPSANSPYALSVASGSFTPVNVGSWNITLPVAGTYFVFLCIRGYVNVPASTTAWILTKLYNSTTASDVPNSQSLIYYLANATSSTIGVQVTTTITNVVTTSTINNVIQVYASPNYILGSSPLIQVVSDGSGMSSLTYMRVS